MIDEEHFENLPEQPELAFVYLEEKYRIALKDELDKADPNSSWDHYYLEYMNAVIAVAEALDLDFLENFTISSMRSNIYQDYTNFNLAVNQFTTKTRIINGKRRRDYSVALSLKQKDEIRKYVNNIKTIVEKSHLPEDKKESIFKKIQALMAEIDRNRTRFEVVADFVAKTGVVSKTAEQEIAGPWWRWIAKIAEIVGGAKADEEGQEQAKLPAPQPQKRLPPPRQQLSSPSRDDDDEIPF